MRAFARQDLTGSMPGGVASDPATTESRGAGEAKPPAAGALRSNHLLDPGGRDDLPALPNPTIEDELTELSQISRPQPQSAGRSRVAVQEAVPHLILYPERLEKRLFGEFSDRLTRDLPQYQPEQPNAAAVVIIRN